jgi:hypothetical protein
MVAGFLKKRADLDQFYFEILKNLNIYLALVSLNFNQASGHGP